MAAIEDWKLVKTDFSWRKIKTLDWCMMSVLLFLQNHLPHIVRKSIFKKKQFSTRWKNSVLMFIVFYYCIPFKAGNSNCLEVTDDHILCGCSDGIIRYLVHIHTYIIFYDLNFYFFWMSKCCIVITLSEISHIWSTFAMIGWLGFEPRTR